MNDDEIDALYQVAPGEFTAARNALAKVRGAAGAAIKTLEKPTLPAWAVNQLYWRERGTYDRLVAATIAMREAHVHAISGRKADVAAAEAAHNSARRTAAALTRRLIEAAGDKVTPATLDAIAETLQALPSNEVSPGRLTRPLKPLGFGELMALGIPVVQGPTRPARRSLGEGGSTVHGSAGHRGPGVQESKGPSKKEIAERVAARKAAAKAVKAAEGAEEKADAALAEAKKSAAQVERELARVRDRLQFLEKQRNDSEELIRQRARELQTASNARIQATQDFDRLQ